MKGHHSRTSSSLSQSEDRRTEKGSATRPILLLVLCLGFLTLVPYCILILLNPALRAVEQAIKAPGKVLLVTAHPDDETVFFAPTVTALQNSGHNVFLLCLTTGQRPFPSFLVSTPQFSLTGTCKALELGLCTKAYFWAQETLVE